MDSQVYSLKWNNFVPNIMSSFRSLRRDRDLVDVTLSCEGKRISVHKVILSACSSYFRTVLKENPAQHPVIIFRNVSFDDLQAIIDFVYNGEVSVEQNRLTAFLQTAELLEIKGLTNESCNSKTAQKTEPYEAETYPTCSKEEPETPEKVFPKAPTKNLERVNESPAKKRKLSEVEITPIEPLGREEETTAAPVALDEADHELSYRSVSPESQAVLISDEELDANEKSVAEAYNRKRNTRTVIGQKSCCSLCNEKSFPDMPSCKAHSSQHFSSAFACNICFKVFPSKELHKMHMSNLHSDRFKCSICSRVFPSKELHKSHMSNFHSDRFQCSICFELFGSMSRLKIHHLKTHLRCL
ncbi:protein bric-a-brac 1-like isoform X3 [Cloeon dipterum]|uniref:protein bric-a-brac 1-like isoform X3 n=1 Tax=Cloeon dipterum TaxID=197152 RepID=UPI0032200E12